jgi:paired amphipathic helix protein Sin3a
MSTEDPGSSFICVFAHLHLRIDTPGVIQRVSRLFHGNPYLIQGFNTFLPLGYRIDISGDPLDPNTITVTTPMGITTQNTNFAHVPRTARDIPGLNPPNIAPPLPFAGPVPILPPLGSVSMPRSLTPHGYHLSQNQSSFDPAYSPGFQNPQTTAAASFLGNLSNRHPVEKQPPGEFNHAIQYLNKIKARYSDDPNTYKRFLDILQTYQKEQRHLQDVSGSFMNVLPSYSIYLFPPFSPRCMPKFFSCSKVPQTCWPNLRTSFPRLLLPELRRVE